MQSEYKIQSLFQLSDFSKDFLKQYPSGAVVGLRGEIGAGKTTFVKTVLGELTTAQNVVHVTSPTYTIHQCYDSPSLKTPVDHFDFYRMGDSNLQSLIEIGYFEIINRSKDRLGFVFIEWPDLFKPINLLQLDLEIHFQLQDSNRIVQVKEGLFH